ncbi:MAG TPA: hypothetical protein PLJ88_00135 [Agitococcus sp.]|nr:hypothetical protein [Agitococcus sp.]
MGGFGVQLIFQLFLLADGYIVAALRSVISGFVDGGFNYLLFLPSFFTMPFLIQSNVSRWI